MNKLYSHTLCRDDEPFTNLVLRRVEPYVDGMFITISKKSKDGTMQIVENFAKEFKNKVDLHYEDVALPADLTKERQRQLDLTPNGHWVLFLDLDDLWLTKSLEQIKTHYLKRDIDAIACKPIQVIDKQYFDLSWSNKWFTKFFKKQAGVHYEKPWPSDLIYLNDQQLYWKKNDRVVKADAQYFHLSNIKYHSFRKEKGFEKYYKEPGPGYFIPEIYKEEMERIYECLK